MTPLLLLRGGPGLSEGLLRPLGWCFCVLLLTGQCGVRLQDPIPSSAGERNTSVQTAPPAAPHVAIFPSPNQRVCPWYGIPITLRTNMSTRAFASRPGHGAWPRLLRADRETPLMASGGVPPREMKWRTPSPPGQAPPGHQLVTGVAGAGSRRCLRKAKRKQAAALGPLCSRVAAGAWTDLFRKWYQLFSRPLNL